VPMYAGLRRFSEGRDFNQWTGDDSKALMKVILFCYCVVRIEAFPRSISLQLLDLSQIM
jgi:hypothetical protein